MILKVVKPKIIDIVDYNYDNLTCVIVMSSSMYFKNTNKMGLLNTKLFMNSGSLFLVNKKYNNETIKRLINCDIIDIKNIYNRKSITIFIVIVDYSLNKIKIDDKEYICNKKCFFMENIDAPKLVKKKSLNEYANKKIIIPYFNIKMKNIIKYLY
tara:strand:- start:211 stop:675 length:465 start_codon:yes stop_codon:yes gene_type:complete